MLLETAVTAKRSGFTPMRDPAVEAADPHPRSHVAGRDHYPAHRVLGGLMVALAPWRPLFGAVSMPDTDGRLEVVAVQARRREVLMAISALDWHQQPRLMATPRGRPVWMAWPALRTELPELSAAPIGAGTWVSLPMDHDGHTIGVLSLCFATRVVLDRRDRSLMKAMALASGEQLADDRNGQRSTDAATTALRDERVRLAADLHDGVVQQVIATSMTLASIAAQVDRTVRSELERLIDRQDDIVRELRSTIFSLQSDAPFNPSTSVELMKVIEQAASALGFPPELHVKGNLERIDPLTQSGQLLFALRELLSNAARHSGATRVVVGVTVTNRTIVLEVHDNGDGIDAAHTAGNGLANLDRRARMLGGTCDARPARQGGTVTRWSIPSTQ